ncbi:MAG: hypothetical protein GY716_15855 [bacterium]|nr:hypothetical protein [bacterium]
MSIHKKPIPIPPDTEEPSLGGELLLRGLLENWGWRTREFVMPSGTLRLEAWERERFDPNQPRMDGVSYAPGTWEENDAILLEGWARIVDAVRQRIVGTTSGKQVGQ